LQNGVTPNAIEGIGHVNGEDDPVFIALACIHKALQTHANELCGTSHGDSTLARLQAPDLSPHFIDAEQAFSNHPPQCLAHCDGTDRTVFLPKRNQICGTEDGPCSGWETLLDA
jgi:hypothetical protein